MAPLTQLVFVNPNGFCDQTAPRSPSAFHRHVLSCHVAPTTPGQHRSAPLRVRFEANTPRAPRRLELGPDLFATGVALQHHHGEVAALVEGKGQLLRHLVRSVAVSHPCGHRRGPSRHVSRQRESVNQRGVARSLRGEEDGLGGVCEEGGWEEWLCSGTCF